MALTTETQSATPGRETGNAGILGIGNLLVRDEGFGVHCIRELQNRYRLPERLEVIDGGTAGIMMAPFMESVDFLYVIDTINLTAEAGSIHCFSDEDILAGNIQAKMSPHQLGLLEILSLCRLRDRAPERVELITVVPLDLATGLGLSPLLAARIDPVLTLLRDKLAGRGMILQEKQVTHHP